MAVTSAKLPTWYRVLASIVGVMTIALAFVVLVDPVLAVWLLVFLLAFGLLFIGMDRLVVGISGQPFWSLGPMTPPTPSQPMAATPISTPAPKP
jgi:hypothetical protein